jgi:hypothetical protein
MPIAIDLDQLRTYAPVLTDAGAAFYRENCIVCLDCHGHASGVGIDIGAKKVESNHVVVWTGEVTDQMKRMTRNQNDRTNFGACAVALRIVNQLTGLYAYE